MPRSAERALLLAAMPAVFVLIWSTGFVVARFGMPHAPPLGFLAWRYAFSVLAFAVWIAATRAAWPRSPAQWSHLAVAGVLMHAGYLGGVWAAVKGGLGAGTAALIVSLQPVLTALWLHSRGGAYAVALRQWLGLVLGFAGLVLVLWHKLGVGEVTPANLALAVFALGAITVGTLYQKRFVAPCDVRTANAVQLMAALVVTAPLAWLEDGRFASPSRARRRDGLVGAGADAGRQFAAVLLIQRGAATRVTSLMYLVPPCTALMAWLLFREALGPAVFAGIGLTALGVALVVREPARG